MAFCQNCGAQIPEGQTFCTNCAANAQAQNNQNSQNQTYAPNGYAQNQYTQNQYAPAAPAPTDHTAEYTPEDISKNKVIAMATYLMGTIGIIIALLAAPDSPYAAFHARQSLKLSITSALIGICTAVLFWTLIVPFAGFICLAIIFVVRIICFFNVASGKAKEAPIISSLGFLK